MDRHQFIPWRATWRLNQKRYRRWTEARNKWRVQMRKEGKLPPKQQRASGPDTNTPSIEHAMSKHRPGRIYRVGRDGRPQRMTTRWLAFPDGRRMRKFGPRRATTQMMIYASIAKVKRTDKWKRPIAKGRLDAYDFALTYLTEDREKLKERSSLNCVSGSRLSIRTLRSGRSSRTR